MISPARLPDFNLLESIDSSVAYPLSCFVAHISKVTIFSLLFDVSLFLSFSFTTAGEDTNLPLVLLATFEFNCSLDFSIVSFLGLANGLGALFFKLAESGRFGFNPSKFSGDRRDPTHETVRLALFSFSARPVDFFFTTFFVGKSSVMCILLVIFPFSLKGDFVFATFTLEVDTIFGDSKQRLRVGNGDFGLEIIPPGSLDALNSPP